MSFESKEAYIARTVEGMSKPIRTAIAYYKFDAIVNGARICNDGYPDCRFKGTFALKHVRARKIVGRIRAQYEHEWAVNVETAAKTAAKKVVCSDVALGIIAELKEMLRNG